MPQKGAPCFTDIRLIVRYKYKDRSQSLQDNTPVKESADTGAGRHREEYGGEARAVARMEEAEKRQAVEQTPAGEGSAETGTETSPNGGNGGNSLLDAVRTLYEKGKAAASKLYSRTYFNVAKTPDFMKELGLTGDRFTIRYGVISRHMGKDGAHEIPVEVWEQLPEALQRPFAITEYYESGEDKASGKNKGYRLYTAIKHGDGYIVVGAEVKNVGRDVEVNSISTVFGRDRRGDLEKEIYRSKEITPEQSSLLDGPNSHQYPTEQESSADKGTTNTGNAQGGGAENAQVKTGQELEKSAKKRQAAVEQQAEATQAAETQATETPVVETPTQTEATEGIAVGGGGAEGNAETTVGGEPQQTDLSGQSDQVAQPKKTKKKSALEKFEDEYLQHHKARTYTHPEFGNIRVLAVDDVILQGEGLDEPLISIRDVCKALGIDEKGATKKIGEHLMAGVLEKEKDGKIKSHNNLFATPSGILDLVFHSELPEQTKRDFIRWLNRKVVPDAFRTEGGGEPKPVGKGPFGNIYDQFKGKAKEAVDFLTKKRSGEAVGALHHKDVGDIDLVWGEEGTGHSDGYGLAKIAKYHPEVLDDLQGVLDGMHVVSSSDNRIVLESDTHKAVVSRKLGDKETPDWLLTAYEKKEGKGKGNSGGSSDIVPEPGKGKQNGTAPLQEPSSGDKGTTNTGNTQGGGAENAQVKTGQELKERANSKASGKKLPADEVDNFDPMINALFDTIQEKKEGDKTVLFSVEDEAIGKANERFNWELDAFKKGEKMEAVHLGIPSSALRASGLNGTEMFITPRTLREHLDKHRLTVDDIRDLPRALQNPLLVYEWGTKAPSMLVITEMEHGDDRITEAVKLERGGKVLEVNEIASVHAKEASHFMNEMTTPKKGGLKEALRWVGDKEKALEWLGMFPPKGTPSLTPEELSVAKVIENFENPKLPWEKIASEGENSGDLRFSTREAAEAGERAQQIVDEAEERIEERRREEEQARANEVARGFGLDGVALPKNAENAEGVAVREAARQGTLRDAMGGDWDKFLEKVYQNTDEETLRDINEYARQNGRNFAEATERYLASLSDNGAFEQAVERGMWNNVREAFDDMLGSRGVEEGVSDNDARYALWRNERNKTERADGTILARATDIATDNSLGNDGDTRFSTDWDEDKNDPDVRYSGGVNELAEVEDVRFGVREEEEKENKPQYGLSEEKDEKGHPFVLSSDGSTTFGEIGKETGLPSAPIKLSEGVITNPLTHAGYGFVHIEARHGDEIRAAGYKSIEEFVDDVARNYTRIVKGKKGAAGGDNSYLMQITDKNNNTLYIELSKDGGYWNVNSGGVFRNNYGDNREEVYSRHATAKQSTETVGETQNTEQGGTQANSRMNSPTPSEGKVTTNPETAKENGENSGDLRFSTRKAEEAGERAQQIVDEAEERIEERRREEQQERANEVARGFGLNGVALPKNAENAEGVAVRELARPASGTKLARCGTKLRSLGRKEPLFAAAAWRLGDLCLPLRPDKRKTDTHRHEKKDDSGGSGGRHHAPGACAGGGAAHEQQPERCLPAQHGPGWTN